ncbi:MAG: branched-chain amino acid ABC transporter permease [Synergistetes bacterium]|nr:branched-chain amino acid ABC transporter permease [Synergistota bacterium]
MEKGKHLYYVVLVVLAIVFPIVFNVPFVQHVAIMVFMYGMLAESWNVIGGYSGLFSFGQAAFFGIGAYTSTLLYMQLGLTPWIGMIAGGLVAIAAGIAIGYPCSKLKGHYFAIATIAFAWIINILFTNWSFVGAATGLSPELAPADSWYAFQFRSSKLPYYYIGLFLMLLTVYVVNKVIKSKTGFYLRALGENEEVAASLGVNIAKYRLISISIASFFTAVAGSFYAQYVLYIDPPSVLAHFLSVEIVLIAMFGGSGTIWGPIWGALILVPLSQYARAIWGGMGSGLDIMVYGFVIMVFSIFRPRGVVSFFIRK